MQQSTGWAYFIPFQPNIQHALLALREDVFRRGAYFKPLVFLTLLLQGNAGQRLPAELRHSIHQQIARLQQQPVPHTITDLIRQQSGEPTYSILDVHRIAARPAAGAVAPLTPRELRAVFGHTQPTRIDITPAVRRRIHSLRPRGHATYVILYHDRRPSEIYFTGVTGD